MGFADEVAQEAVPAGRPNVFEAFVYSLPEKERAELRDLLADRTVSAGAIYRAMKRRGFKGHESTVFRHARYARTGR